MTSRPGSRCGIVTWFVMCLAVVIAILMFAFNMMARQRNVQAHFIYFGQVAQGLAEAGSNMAWSRLRQDLTGRGSTTRARLVAATPDELRAQPLPLFLEPSKVEALLAGLEGGHLEVSGRILEAGFLDPPDLSRTIHDPIEKELVIEVTARATYREIERTVVQSRACRVQLDNVPVLSRFTLFVKQPEREDGGLPGGYNQFANEINGRVDTSVPPGENSLPLILYNHGEAFARTSHDLEENGWVYLGGDRPVVLNLTSGGDFRYGQYFHFTNLLQAAEAQQAAFTSAAPPDFFQQVHEVGGIQHRYALKHVKYGYFTRDQSTPPADMNKDRLLDPYFKNARTMRSSTLHLYGSSFSPSPTRVFGPVYTSYPIFTGITVDTDGDAQRDGIVTLLPAIEAGDFPHLASIAPIPSAIPDLRRAPGMIPLDTGLLRYETMFRNAATYARFSSMLVEAEPYNSGLDSMLGRGEHPPAARQLDPAKDYPNPGDLVEIRRRSEAPGSPPHFRGNLAHVGPEVLADRMVLEVEDGVAFAKLFVRGRSLHLGVPVRIASGGLVLPPDLFVSNGGVIMCPGDISFDGIDCPPGERLVLVSLQGNIRSAFSEDSESNPAEADLIALQGTVASSDPGHPMFVRGTVAAGRFSPQGFRQGGTLLYPGTGDPASRLRADSARILLSDTSTRWSL